MPDDMFRDETDGNPNTEYEDTEVHDRTGDRTGFYVNDKDKLKTKPQEPE